MNTTALVPREDGTPETLDWLRAMVLASVTSPHSKRNYAKAFEEVGKFLAAVSQTSLGRLCSATGRTSSNAGFLPHY